MAAATQKQQTVREKAAIQDIQEMQRLVERQVADEKISFAQEHKQDIELTSKKVLAALDANEDGDAWMFNQITCNKFVYDHAAAEWFQWEGHQWIQDARHEVMRTLDGVIDIYGKEADRQAWLATKARKAKKNDPANEHEELRARLLRRIDKLQTLHRKRNVLNLATAGNGLTDGEWDSNPWLLGCKNGVIDLKTGNFRPRDQHDYMKTIAPTEWKGLEVPARDWQNFVCEIFDGEEELMRFVQRLFGYRSQDSGKNMCIR